MIRVVVVDDEPLIRMGLRMVLDAEDDVELVGEAADGGAALTLLRRTTPHVVFMDVRMPVYDGWRHCARSRPNQRWPRCGW